MKMAAYIITTILIAIIAAPTVVVSIENAQEKANKELLDKDQVEVRNAENVVIYFSRSGNTAVMAKTIAKIFKADLINIDASKYKVDFGD